MSKQIGVLDRYDRRLLVELDRNSRQSFADLARSLEIPEETVRYRVNSLVERGIITGFFTVIDAGQLGNGYYKILLKLHNVDEPRVEQIIKYLIECDAVNWVARFDVHFDIGFTIRVTKVFELSQFVDELRRRFTKYINKLTFAINIETEFLSRNYIADSAKKRDKAIAIKAPSAPVKLDQLDLDILRQIAGDTRRPATEIAKIVGVTSETVHQRIKKLEKQRIIIRYSLVIDVHAIAQINYYVLVFLNYTATERLASFVQYCREIPRLSYLIKALGEWDYELNLEVESLEQYRNIMMDLTSKYSDIVRDYHGMPVSKVYKLTFEP
jgi:DNA-binding Lrp family transcriptional regulator